MSERVVFVIKTPMGEDKIETATALGAELEKVANAINEVLVEKYGVDRYNASNIADTASVWAVPGNAPRNYKRIYFDIHKDLTIKVKTC